MKRHPVLVPIIELTKGKRLRNWLSIPGFEKLDSRLPDTKT
jgi:hypothetical protein